MHDYLRSVAAGIDPSAVVFTESVPHQGVLVPFKVLDLHPGRDITLLVKLAAGWRFSFETHPYEERMYIVRGRGVFREEGIIRPFRTGDEIVVPTGAEHAFVRVDEETLFVKHVPDLYATRAAA